MAPCFRRKLANVRRHHVYYWIFSVGLYPVRQYTNNCSYRHRGNFTTELSFPSRSYLCHSYLLSIIFSIFIQTVYRPVLRPTLDVGHAMNYWWYEWIWKCFRKGIHHFGDLSDVNVSWGRIRHSTAHIPLPPQKKPAEITRLHWAESKNLSH